jgi:hypothetical protein
VSVVRSGPRLRASEALAVGTGAVALLYGNLPERPVGHWTLGLGPPRGPNPAEGARPELLLTLAAGL